jgi:hypothetical protein
VRAHETDTNAWYPVAPTQPRASAIRRQRSCINAHQLCREEEQLRAASKGAKKIVKGSARAMRAMGRARRDASNSNARGKYSGSCEGRDGHPENRTKRNAITHLSPGSRGPVFLRNRHHKRGKGFCRNGPGPLPTDRGPASAGACADDPLRPPRLTLCCDSEVALRLAGSCWASFSTVKHGQLPLQIPKLFRLA